MEENVEFSLKLIRRAISKNLKLIVPTFEAVRSSLDKFEALTKDAPFTKGDCSGALSALTFSWMTFVNPHHSKDTTNSSAPRVP